MLSKRRRASLSAVILLTAGLLSAQTTDLTDGTTPPGIAPGAPAGSYPLSGLDTVNLFNGNLNFRLPLLEVDGRGAARYTITLLIERHWRIVRDDSASPPLLWGVDTPWAPAGVRYGPGSMVGRWGKDYAPCSDPNSSTVSTMLTRITFTAPDGTEYEFIDQQTGGALQSNPRFCIPFSTAPLPSRGKIFTTIDGTAATFVSDDIIFDDIWNDTFPTTGNLHFRDGTLYRIEGGLVRWIRDRNGNRLEFPVYDDNSRVKEIRDSLNRTITINYGSTDTGIDEIIFKGFGGKSRTIKVGHALLQHRLRPGGGCPQYGTGYCSKTVRQLFEPDTTLDSTGMYDPRVTAWVELPDSRRYEFYYNNYGELARVDLPTGGRFEYDFGSGVGNQTGAWTDLLVYRRVKERRIYREDGVLEKREQFSNSDSSGATNNTVTVDHLGPTGTTPLARDAHYFTGTPKNAVDQGPTDYARWREGREHQTESGASTAVMRRESHTWAQRGTGCNSIIPADTARPDNPRIIQTDTTLVDTNQVSRHAFTYDQFNNKCDVEEYAFGAGAPGPLIRKTHTDYVTVLNGVDYTSAATLDGSGNVTARLPHLRSLPSLETVYDGAETQEARTRFEYDVHDTSTGHAAIRDYQALGQTPISGHNSWLGASCPADVRCPTFEGSYTRRGNVTGVFRWLNSTGGEISSYNQYDIAGNVLSSIDGRGFATNFTFTDAFGSPDNEARGNTAPAELGTALKSYAFVTSESNALSQTSYTQYDYYLGRPVNTEDANGPPGVITSATSLIPGTCPHTDIPCYDRLDRVTQVVRAVGLTSETQTTFTYDDGGRTVWTTRDLNASGDNAMKSFVVFDGLGREAERHTIEPGGTPTTGHIITRQTYDALGRVSQVSNPYRTGETPAWTTTSYDALGRVTLVTMPDTAQVTTAYSGNEATVTDPAGKKRRTTTDALGRVKEVVEDPGTGTLNLSTTYLYDTSDNLTEVNQGVQKRIFKYDSLDRLTSAWNPESATTSYSYDANGNVTQKTDARGVSVNYGYDALNRETSRDYSNTTVNPDVTRAYDTPTVSYAKGRPTSVTRWLSSSEVFSTTNIEAYDALGRVTQSKQTGVASSFTYGYNRAGLLTSQTYPSQRTASFVYDEAARLVNVNAAATPHYATAITYTPQSTISVLPFGNALRETRSYNNRLQPTRIQLGTAATPASLLQLDFEYTATGIANSGNLHKQTITLPGPTTLTQTHVYDELNRLKEIFESSNAGFWFQQYGYDRYGNMWVSYSGVPLLMMTPRDQTWFGSDTQANTACPGFPSPLTGQPAVCNRIVGSGYDAAGNQISAAGATFEFDAENRQTKARIPSSGSIFQDSIYEYDGDGRRVKKTVHGSTGTYIYDIFGKLAAEYWQPAGGTVQWRKDFIYAGDRLLAMEDSAGRSYITQDHLGSTRVATNSSAAVESRHDYLPFGKEVPDGYGGRMVALGYTSQQNPAQQNILQRFTGKELDPETGLQYFGARYYSGRQGRFTSVDPSGESIDEVNPQTWNRYSYTFNNPLKFTDPDGEAPSGRDLLDFAAGAAKGAASAISMGTMPGSAPSPTDSTANLAGQAVGATVAGLFGFFAGTTEAIVTAPAAVTVVGAAIPAAGAAAAGASLTGMSVTFAKINQEAIRRGRASQERVLNDEGISKNTKSIEAVDPKTGKVGKTIPDGMERGVPAEVKDRARVADSPQLRRQSEVADRLGKRSKVFVGTRTSVSRRVQERHRIKRREDLGPEPE